MKIEKSKYFVLRLNGNQARVVSMHIYPMWRKVNSRSKDTQCLNVTKEEAHVFIKIMGLEDVTNVWATPLDV